MARLYVFRRLLDYGKRLALGVALFPVAAGTTVNCTLGAVVVSGANPEIEVGTTVAVAAGAVTVAGYNNLANTNGTMLLNQDFVAITDGQPLTNPANDDFEPNATALRGALLRGAGYVPYGQTANIDIGAVQHEDPAGGGAASGVRNPFGGPI